jgi:DNA-binding transcriptional ArsR family regulator
MKEQPVSLMPILRSNAQGRMLAILFANPGREFAVGELAESVETSPPTALREVRRLEQAQLVQVRALGNTRLVSINQQHRLYGPLAEVILYSFGPFPVLQQLVASLPGAERAYIYGSWAARYLGDAGHDPEDVDLLLVGDIDRQQSFELARVASKRIGKEVNVNNLSAADWKRAESSFVKTVKSRPLLELTANQESRSSYTARSSAKN